jgi:hypothetical protein
VTDPLLASFSIHAAKFGIFQLRKGRAGARNDP